MDTHTPWHRLLGMALTDLFTGRPWRVELETELALKSQRLDLLIIERGSSGAAPGNADILDNDWPDGLDNLAAHNLMTYKSHQESLDAWALEELTGHYVTYRKLCSIQAAQTRRVRRRVARLEDVNPMASFRLLPAADFRRYAVATRPPRRLFHQLPPGTRHATDWPGVYDLDLGISQTRLIVIDTLDPHPRNAPWEMFASAMERRRQGLVDYHARGPIGHLLRHQLAHVYHLEVPDMAYTVNDFKRDTFNLLIQELGPLTPEQTQVLLARMDVADVLRGLPPEERLRGLPPEERLRGLPPEERLRGLPPEERLRGLGPDELRQLQEYLKTIH